MTHDHRLKESGPHAWYRKLSCKCSSSIYTVRKISFITSRVSGRGHRIGAVCECVCVCVSALSLPNCLTYDLDLWYSAGTLAHRLSGPLCRDSCDCRDQKVLSFQRLGNVWHGRCVNDQAFSLSEGVGLKMLPDIHAYMHSSDRKNCAVIKINSLDSPYT